MQIGVVGSWEEDLKEEIYELAEGVGRWIAKRGGVLLTGGSTGVMQAAMKGAKRENGLTVGVIPTERKEAYAFLGKYSDVHIMTGMGEYGKTSPLIHSVDGIIAIAGGAGTLIEISMAYLQNKPIVSIPVAGYTTDRIRGMLEDAYLDHRRVRKLVFAMTPEEAVDLLYTLIEEKDLLPV